MRMVPITITTLGDEKNSIRLHAASLYGWQQPDTRMAATGAGDMQLPKSAKTHDIYVRDMSSGEIFDVPKYPANIGK